MTAPHPLLAALVARRRELGITQETVAQALGICRSHLTRVEGGHHQPSIPTLARYAEVVGARLVVRIERPVGDEMDGAVAS